MTIGIGGADCSGKTTFAFALEGYLKSRGLDVLLIHMDDFHNPREVRSRDSSPQGYFDNAFDLRTLSTLLAELKVAPAKKRVTLLDLDKDE